MIIEVEIKTKNAVHSKSARQGKALRASTLSPGISIFISKGPLSAIYYTRRGGGSASWGRERGIKMYKNVLWKSSRARQSDLIPVDSPGWQHTHTPANVHAHTYHGYLGTGHRAPGNGHRATGTGTPGPDQQTKKPTTFCHQFGEINGINWVHSNGNSSATHNGEDIPTCISTEVRMDQMPWSLSANGRCVDYRYLKQRSIVIRNFQSYVRRREHWIRRLRV